MKEEKKPHSLRFLKKKGGEIRAIIKNTKFVLWKKLNTILKMNVT